MCDQKIRVLLIAVMAGCGASCILAAVVLRLSGISDVSGLESLAAASLGYLAGMAQKAVANGGKHDNSGN